MIFTESEQKYINAIVLKIDRLRVERGYSIYELSVKSGLSENTLKHIYKKKSFPNTLTVYRICKVFSITLWQFFYFDESDILFSEKEFQLISDFENLNDKSKVLLSEVAKNLK